MPDTQQQTGEKFIGPDGKPWILPKGTTKEQATDYFKKQGITGAAPKPHGEFKGTSGGTAEFQTGLLSGVTGSILGTANVVSGLANKALPASMQIPKIPKEYTEQRTPAEKLGGAGEMGLEYIAGAGEVKAGINVGFKMLGAAIEAKNVPKILELVKAHPYLAKAAVAGMRDFITGTGQAALHGEPHPLTKGKWTGIIGAAGEGGAAPLEEMGAKSLSKAYVALTKLIGVKKTDLEKWEQSNIKNTEEVGKAVLDRVGFTGSLEDLHVRIEKAREDVQAETENLVKNTVGSKMVSFHAMLDDIKKDLIDKIEKTGPVMGGSTQEMKDAVEKNYQEAKKFISSPFASPEKTLEFRRMVLKRLKGQLFGDKPTGVEKDFLQRAYQKAGDGIDSALPDSVKGQFGKLNRLQSRLIIGRDAAEEKIRSTETKEVGLATKLARHAIGAGVGGVLGYLGGQHFGEGAASAAGGAILGGATGSKIDLPRADVGIQVAKSKIGPALAYAARKSPAIARAIESYKAAHGGGSGSIGQQ